MRSPMPLANVSNREAQALALVGYMIASAAISLGLRTCTAFGSYNAVEDSLRKGFVSGVGEEGHGLSSTSKRGL
jgi:hypothetical protein